MENNELVNKKKYEKAVSTCEYELENLDNILKSAQSSAYYNEKDLLNAMMDLKSLGDYKDSVARLAEYQKEYDLMTSKRSRRRKIEKYSFITAGVAACILTAFLVSYNAKPKYSKFDNYSDTLILTDKSKTTVRVPKSVHYQKVKGVKFYNCPVRHVSLPDNLTSVSFHNCKNLEEVKIPSKVTEIGDSAFSGCYSLKKVTIPDGVTSIGTYAFSSCEALTEITLPSTMTELGADCFCESGLTSLTVPGGVSVIPDSFVLDSDSLESVVMEEGVKEISNYAFSDCSALTTLTIPSTLTYIGRSFIRYSGVTAINYAGTLAEWDAITKDDAWIWGCYDVTLTCTDGTKTLSYTY